MINRIQWFSMIRSFVSVWNKYLSLKTVCASPELNPCLLTASSKPKQKGKPLASTQM